MTDFLHFAPLGHLFTLKVFYTAKASPKFMIRNVTTMSDGQRAINTSTITTDHFFSAIFRALVFFRGVLVVVSAIPVVYPIDTVGLTKGNNLWRLANPQKQGNYLGWTLATLLFLFVCLDQGSDQSVAGRLIYAIN